MAQDVYELGSVFKIFTFAMALEEHTLRSLDEVFPIGQAYKLGKHSIHEAEHMPATLAARDILAQSSNIGTLQIALRSGPTRQRAFLDNLGLLKPMRTDLPETARPLYPAVANWGQTETATLYIFRALDDRQYVGAYSAALVLGLISLTLVLGADMLRGKEH